MIIYFFISLMVFNKDANTTLLNDMNATQLHFEFSDSEEDLNSKRKKERGLSEQHTKEALTYRVNQFSSPICKWMLSYIKLVFCTK